MYDSMRFVVLCLSKVCQNHDKFEIILKISQDSVKTGKQRHVPFSFVVVSLPGIAGLLREKRIIPAIVLHIVASKKKSISTWHVESCFIMFYCLWQKKDRTCPCKRHCEKTSALRYPNIPELR